MCALYPLIFSCSSKVTTSRTSSRLLRIVKAYLERDCQDTGVDLYLDHEPGALGSQPQNPKNPEWDGMKEGTRPILLRPLPANAMEWDDQRLSSQYTAIFNDKCIGTCLTGIQ